jgi:hypothetical protein
MGWSDWQGSGSPSRTIGDHHGTSVRIVNHSGAMSGRLHSRDACVTVREQGSGSHPITLLSACSGGADNRRSGSHPGRQPDVPVSHVSKIPQTMKECRPFVQRQCPTTIGRCPGMIGHFANCVLRPPRTRAGFSANVVFFCLPNIGVVTSGVVARTRRSRGQVRSDSRTLRWAGV